VDNPDRLPEDWKASWITLSSASAGTPHAARLAAGLLRKTFELESVVDCALVHVNAIGYFELYVNGEKVGMMS
jgi:hypothetical protein